MTPDDEPHVCKPDATTYYCPQAGEVESDCHGGFDVCCAHPELHRPISGPDLMGEVERLATELYQSEDARAWTREQCTLRERSQKASAGQGEVQTGEVLAWLEGPKCSRQLGQIAPTVNPPGSTREQLPADVLALLTPRTYLSTACETARLLDGAIIRNPGRGDLPGLRDRMHQRCRLGQKFTGAACTCPCHKAGAKR